MRPVEGGMFSDDFAKLVAAAKHWRAHPRYNAPAASGVAPGICPPKQGAGTLSADKEPETEEGKGEEGRERSSTGIPQGSDLRPGEGAMYSDEFAKLVARHWRAQLPHNPTTSHESHGTSLKSQPPHARHLSPSQPPAQLRSVPAPSSDTLLVYHSTAAGPPAPHKPVPAPCPITPCTGNTTAYASLLSHTLTAGTNSLPGVPLAQCSTTAPSLSAPIPPSTPQTYVSRLGHALMQEANASPGTPRAHHKATGPVQVHHGRHKAAKDCWGNTPTYVSLVGHVLSQGVNSSPQLSCAMDGDEGSYCERSCQGDSCEVDSLGCATGAPQLTSGCALEGLVTCDELEGPAGVTAARHKFLARHRLLVERMGGGEALGERYLRRASSQVTTHASQVTGHTTLVASHLSHVTSPLSEARQTHLRRAGSDAARLAPDQQRPLLCQDAASTAAINVRTERMTSASKGVASASEGVTPAGANTAGDDGDDAAPEEGSGTVIGSSSIRVTAALALSSTRSVQEAAILQQKMVVRMGSQRRERSPRAGRGGGEAEEEANSGPRAGRGGRGVREAEAELDRGPRTSGGAKTERTERGGGGDRGDEGEPALAPPHVTPGPSVREGEGRERGEEAEIGREVSPLLRTALAPVPTQEPRGMPGVPHGTTPVALLRTVSEGPERDGAPAREGTDGGVPRAEPGLGAVRFLPQKSRLGFGLVRTVSEGPEREKGTAGPGTEGTGSVLTRGGSGLSPVGFLPQKSRLGRGLVRAVSVGPDRERSPAGSGTEGPGSVRPKAGSGLNAVGFLPQKSRLGRGLVRAVSEGPKWEKGTAGAGTEGAGVGALSVHRSAVPVQAQCTGGAGDILGPGSPSEPKLLNQPSTSRQLPGDFLLRSVSADPSGREGRCPGAAEAPGNVLAAAGRSLLEPKLVTESPVPPTKAPVIPSTTSVSPIQAPVPKRTLLRTASAGPLRRGTGEAGNALALGAAGQPAFEPKPPTDSPLPPTKTPVLCPRTPVLPNETPVPPIQAPVSRRTLLRTVSAEPPGRGGVGQMMRMIHRTGSDREWVGRGSAGTNTHSSSARCPSRLNWAGAAKSRLSAESSEGPGPSRPGRPLSLLVASSEGGSRSRSRSPVPEVIDLSARGRVRLAAGTPGPAPESARPPSRGAAPLRLATGVPELRPDSTPPPTRTTVPSATRVLGSAGLEAPAVADLPGPCSARGSTGRAPGTPEPVPSSAREGIQFSARGRVVHAPGIPRSKGGVVSEPLGARNEGRGGGKGKGRSSVRRVPSALPVEAEAKPLGGKQLSKKSPQPHVGGSVRGVASALSVEEEAKLLEGKQLSKKKAQPHVGSFRGSLPLFCHTCFSAMEDL